MRPRMKKVLLALACFVVWCGNGSAVEIISWPPGDTYYNAYYSFGSDPEFGTVESFNTILDAVDTGISGSYLLLDLTIYVASGNPDGAEAPARLLINGDALNPSDPNALWSANFSVEGSEVSAITFHTHLRLDDPLFTWGVMPDAVSGNPALNVVLLARATATEENLEDESVTVGGDLHQVITSPDGSFVFIWDDSQTFSGTPAAFVARLQRLAEPGSLALIGIGLAGIAFSRRKRTV